MIRTSWRGKRLWNLSIVRVHVTIRPRILILRVDTHFSPRDLLVQVVKKHLRGARERREQFFQHVRLFFDEKKRIATIKFNILILTTRKLIITDLSWIFNEYDNLIFGSLPIYIIFLSIILCVFNRNRTINTRKKKKKKKRCVLIPFLDRKVAKHFGTKQNGGSATAVITSEVMGEESS